MQKIGYYDYKKGHIKMIDFIDCIGKENIIYVDTDSIFFFIKSETEKKILKMMSERNVCNNE